MSITAAMVKELRDKTNAGMMDCKKALTESDGDMEKAIDWLRQKGLSVAAKRAGRVASEGQVASYIHAGGKLGVMVEVNCETDFTGKTDEFSAFAKDLAMHIAASNPLCVNEEELPPEVLEREREIYKAQALDQGKPENIVDKIIEGKLKKFAAESCLMNQPFVKDTDKTIADLVNELRAQTGENIQIRRFARFVLGEES
ncbi:MAG: translation elongation factor Ts [Desulfarculaceae bacterium]|nr:translation elongation factor Ts [Desulfarculaceae bacterium]MCF8046599.1 translation elongation factor Ts [Desulfarculaceae bacterium]MCF8065021.1 translation elongation factor Ts [Desulfarculaceae bacterium]MCF8098312.1 translation elongation factor Ts [Desulfarculaceae bacterium]MCF8123327.1 translation elongation factor Ts [Desulfarculaceae bacterium]